MRLKDRVEKGSRIVEKATEYAVIPITILFLAFVFLAVVTRFILKVPIVASLEYSRIGFVWFCFLGSSLAYKRGEHIQFSFMLSKLPVKIAQFMRMVVDLLCFTFFAVLLYQSIKLNKNVSLTVFPASGLPYVVMYASLPISAVCSIVHTAYFFIRDVEPLFLRKHPEDMCNSGKGGNEQ